MNNNDDKLNESVLLESRKGAAKTTKHNENPMIVHDDDQIQQIPLHQALSEANQEDSTTLVEENTFVVEDQPREDIGTSVVEMDTVTKKARKRERSIHDEEEPPRKKPHKSRLTIKIPSRVPVIIGKVYSLGGLISKGAYGSVHIATHVHTNNKVALKLISRNNGQLNFERDFQTECRILRILKGKHRNVTHCEGVFTCGTRHCLVLQLGHLDLFDYLGLDKQDASTPDLTLIRKCMRAILKGLAFAHEQGILHRDIKPENVLVMRRVAPHLLTEDDFQIADWGLGHMQDDYTGGAIYTNRRVGTFPYFPIELCGFNPPEFDGRKGDIWSLGMVLAAISGYMSSDWMDVFYNFDLEPEKFRQEIKQSVLQLWMDGAGDVEDMLHHLLTVDIEDRPLAEDALGYDCFTQETL